jgi:hypothetical protein
MKVLAAILIFVSFGVIARAQTPPTPAVTVVSDAKVTGGVTVSGNRSIKNSPFSADAISESIQTLADGNRIVRTSTSKLYRNSEGRFRQELAGGSGGAFGSFFTYGDGVTIVNPGQGSFVLDSTAKIARSYQDLADQYVALAPLAATSAVRAVEAARLSPEARADIEKLTAEVDKIKGSREQIAAVKDELKAAAERMATTSMYTAGVGNTVMALPTIARGPKYESRTEDLGEQSYEGISAHGTRTITTIPANAIGNERPIEITYEKWFSDELQMVVYSKQSDPRTGEHTYRLTNINRSEPDPSLFKVPNGFKVVSGSQGGVYTVNQAGTVSERAAASKVVTGQGVSRAKNQN